MKVGMVKRWVGFILHTEAIRAFDEQSLVAELEAQEQRVTMLEKFAREHLEALYRVEVLDRPGEGSSLADSQTDERKKRTPRACRCKKENLPTSFAILGTKLQLLKVGKLSNFQGVA